MILWCTILTGKEWLRGKDPVWVLVRTRLNSQSKTAWARMSHGGCEIHVHQPIPSGWLSDGKLCEDHCSQWVCVDAVQSVLWRRAFSLEWVEQGRVLTEQWVLLVLMGRDAKAQGKALEGMWQYWLQES